ncbi:MAG: TAXI family TRAP transporter solute-binding subunit, partial [Natronospirillum sp.]
GLSLRQIFVRRNANIKSPEDLHGKTWINAMPANPDILKISEALVKTTGLNVNDIQLASMTTSGEAVDGFTARTIDAVTLPASAGAPHVTRLFDGEVIEYLRISDELADAMGELLPRGLNVGTLPAGTYPNQDEDAVVFEVRTLLVAHVNTPDDVVYEIAKAVFENREELSTYHASASNWTIENTVNRTDLPLHAGTIRYLKEVGEWNSQIEAHQASF